MTNESYLDVFKWKDISIQTDSDNNCFLILVCEDEDTKEIIYEVLSKVKTRLDLFIDPITKIYSFNLVFHYNKSKDIEFSYDTNLTSDGYSSLILLNNGTVKFITTGVADAISPRNIFSRRPLLPLDCLMMPN